jgi:integrase/recombinase XerD
LLGSEAVEPAERYLRWLTHLERSPNTVRAYGLDLKMFWTFLLERGIDWRELSLEQMGEFVAWLRQPAGNVLLLPGAHAQRSRRTVNRTLAAIHGFYDYAILNGVQLSGSLTDARRSGRGPYKPFLHGLAQAPPRGRLTRLPETKRTPRTLTTEQVAAILEAQSRLRNRLLFALLFATGMRIGQALGLRHEDFVSRELKIRIIPREDNANGARGKRGTGEVPISRELARLYSDYLHEEYGDLASDYVFVNLWGGQIGAAMTYAAVVETVKSTREKVGFHFTPHMFRHTFVTLLRRNGVPLDVVSKLVTHVSATTTSDIYTDFTPEDLRASVESAGVLLAAGEVVR